MGHHVTRRYCRDLSKDSNKDLQDKETKCKVQQKTEQAKNEKGRTCPKKELYNVRGEIS